MAEANLWKTNPLKAGASVKTIIHRGTSTEYVDTGWDVHPGNILADHRYSEVGTGAVYGATSRETAVQELGGWADVEDLALPYRTVSVDNVLDLTDAGVRRQLGVKFDDLVGKGYDLTHQIRNWARSTGYTGILAPSAANTGGTNLIAFNGL